MRHVFVSMFVLLAGLSVAQAPDFGGKAQVAAIGRLSFLMGDWEGTGWIEYGGRKFEFKGSEQASLGAGGTVLAVRGVHTASMQGRDVVIHDAFAIIEFDEKKSAFQMTAHLSNGLRNQYALSVTDKGYQWELKGSPMGDVRYTMKLTAAGEWHEIGEVKQSDGTYTMNFEMTLKKKSAAK